MVSITPATTYDTDFYAWTQEQADLLRQGRLEELDLVNLIEELETLGRSEFEAFESAIHRLTQHLLKWQYQPERREFSRSWLLTISEQRRRIIKKLRQNPSFKTRLAEAITEGYQDGRESAAIEADKPLDLFPEQCPYTWEQMIDKDWLPD
jgi:hypothetical protein